MNYENAVPKHWADHGEGKIKSSSFIKVSWSALIIQLTVVPRTQLINVGSNLIQLSVYLLLCVQEVVTHFM